MSVTRVTDKSTYRKKRKEYKHLSRYAAITYGIAYPVLSYVNVVQTCLRHLVKRIIPQSTGGSTGEDEEELSGTCLETKHNTHHNEFLDHELIEVSAINASFLSSYMCGPTYPDAGVCP